MEFVWENRKPAQKFGYRRVESLATSFIIMSWKDIQELWDDTFANAGRAVTKPVFYGARRLGMGGEFMDNMEDAIEGLYTLNPMRTVRAGQRTGEWLDRSLTFPGDPQQWTNPRFDVPRGRTLGDVDDATVARIAETLKRRAPRVGLPVTKRTRSDPPSYDPDPPGDVVMMEPVRSPQNKMLLGARKWRRSNTHGYTGVMRKRYRRLPIDSVAKNGAALVQEVGSTFNGVECVYLGHHQAPIKKLIRALAMALTRRIAKVLHQDFNSFEELMHKYYNSGETTTKLQLKYKTGIDGAVINATDVTYVNGDTWRTFAEKIADVLIGAMNGTRNFELVDMVIASTTAADIAPVPMHRWNPRNMYLSFNCVSKLTFQNETLADETGASHHEDSAHITNNPLRCRAYMFRGNYLRFRNHDPDSAVGQQAISANNGTGVIAIAADDFTDAPNLNTLLKLPPAYFFEGKVKTYNFTLAPGEIKKSIIKWKKTMGINSFLQRVLDCAQSAASDVDQIINGYSNPIGWSEVFAMEKECDTGATGGEPQVQVGYEINTYVACIVKGGKYVPTVPHVVVADS